MEVLAWYVDMSGIANKNILKYLRHIGIKNVKSSLEILKWVSFYSEDNSIPIHSMPLEDQEEVH